MTRLPYKIMLFWLFKILLAICSFTVFDVRRWCQPWDWFGGAGNVKSSFGRYNLQTWSGDDWIVAACQYICFNKGQPENRVTCLPGQNSGVDLPADPTVPE